MLNISCGLVYCVPHAVLAGELAIMRRLDELHLEFPFASPWVLRGLLVGEVINIGRRRIRSWVKRMGIEALYQGPRTTKPEPGHKISP